MCRIAGYLGPSLGLDEILLSPPRSLRDQGRCPRELPPGMLGSDGFGVAWYAEGKREPARYRHILPIWVDENLDTLAPYVSSSCIVAMTRTATRHMPVTMSNTPPYPTRDGAVLVHNGSIDAFHEKVAEGLRARLRVETRACIQGNSDTEYLTALVADAQGSDLLSRVRAMLHLVTDHVKAAGVEAQLNVIVANGEEMVGVRYAVGKDAPTLYYTQRPHGGVLVASEPLDEDESWTRIACDSVVSIRRGHAPRVQAFP